MVLNKKEEKEEEKKGEKRETTEKREPARVTVTRQCTAVACMTHAKGWAREESLQPSCSFTAAIEHQQIKE